jgi:hypothetical protein
MNQAIAFLNNTFTSSSHPQFSNNPDKIDEVFIDRRMFLDFIKEQETTFMCTFSDRSSRTNNRRAKNLEYLSAAQITVPPRPEFTGRPSPLFAAVS